MPTQEEIIKEVLKFDPGRKQTPPVDDSVIKEVLKFDPGRIGGTYQPKPSPFPGGTGPISTITGKPETIYVPGEDPGANMATLAKVGYVDDPKKKIEIFAKARGIPISEYRTFNGEIIFRNSQGRWQKEVGEMPISALKKGVVQTLTNPAIIGGVVGAVGGPKTALLGAMGGEGIRKAVGAAAFGEEQTTAGNILDMATEGVLAGAGEIGGKGIRAIMGRFKMGPRKVIKYAGHEIIEGALKPQDHAKAEVVRAIARSHGIDLAPHQLYDKEGMTNIWMYLRKHPVTSDKIRAFEDQLANQSDEAIQKFIRDMGGFEETPFIVGEKLQKMASKSIESAKTIRRNLASPLYQKAFKAEATVDIKPVIEYIDVELATAKGEVRNQLLKAKNILEKPDLPKGTKPELSWDTSLQGLHGSKVEFDRIIKNAQKDSLGNTIKRHYQKIQNTLLEQMDAASPDYAAARQRFAELSEPVDALKQSVLGELDRLMKEGAIAKAPGKLLDLTNMPDAELLKKAKATIEPQDPEAWRNMVGSYIRDVYEGLRVTEEGKVVNAVGKLHKKLFGSQKQREIMQAAMSPDEYKNLESLMTVFQRAAIGTRSQSMTQPFRMIEEQFGKIPGSKAYRFGMFPRQATVESLFGKWNDVLVSGRQRELLKALTSKDAVEQIKKLKPLTPGSKKLIDGLSVYTTMISTKIGLEDIGEELPK